MAGFSNAYTFGFAFAVCVVCSTAVASVSIGLRDLQEVNKRRDLQGNILVALGLPEDGSIPRGETIDKLWEERVELRVVDASGKLVTGSSADRNGDGTVDQEDVDLARDAVKGTDKSPELLSVYVRKDGQGIGAIGIPLNGKGLWGPISGYLALDPGGTEVTGATFFAPKETPGLGAEITQPRFKEQWVGKKVVDSSGATEPIRVVKGEASVLCPDDLEHCVDGVSGATITSRGVDAMVAEALDRYDPYLKQIRGR